MRLSILAASAALLLSACAGGNEHCACHDPRHHHGPEGAHHHPHHGMKNDVHRDHGDVAHFHQGEPAYKNPHHAPRPHQPGHPYTRKGYPAPNPVHGSMKPGMAVDSPYDVERNAAIDPQGRVVDHEVCPPGIGHKGKCE